MCCCCAIFFVKACKLYKLVRRGRLVDIIVAIYLVKDHSQLICPWVLPIISFHRFSWQPKHLPRSIAHRPLPCSLRLVLAPVIQLRNLRQHVRRLLLGLWRLHHRRIASIKGRQIFIEFLTLRWFHHFARFIDDKLYNYLYILYVD